MGGTTSGERIQLRGRPRAHRRPPVPIGDAHGLRLVRGDPGRGLKPQRVLPRAVRTRSSGRPGGSATAKGSARGDVVGERKRRPGAGRATTPPSRSALLCLIRAMHKGHAGVGRAGASQAGGPRGGARLDSWGKGRGDPARSAPALVRGDPDRHRAGAVAERRPMLCNQSVPSCHQKEFIITSSSTPLPFSVTTSL